MKELSIPYIGIKIDAIPTILITLKNSKDEEEFINHFVKKLGKARKTVTEYLASLRNLKLATRDKKNQTVITKEGMYLIEDNIEYFYKNLLKHCLKRFSDLNIIKNYLKEKKKITLKELVKKLQNDNYSIKREVTLSSYIKIFFEAEFKINNIVRKPVIKSQEVLEYNQFKKIINFLSQQQESTNYTIVSLKKYIDSNFAINVTDAILAKYLKAMERGKKIKLYQVNANIINDKTMCLKIGDKFYYNFEVIDNVT